MEEFEKRMFQEFTELDARYQKLTAFLESEEKRNSVDPEMLSLMYQQHTGMEVYRGALMSRINKLGFLEYPLVKLGEVITTDKDEALRCVALDPQTYEPTFEMVSTL